MTVKVTPTLAFETKFWQQGFPLVAGVDEAGRGAWAGPVCAGAVILPADRILLRDLSGVRDSKLLSPQQREAAGTEIRRLSTAWGVGYASSVEIDSLGIVPATKLAMRRAIQQCLPMPQALLIDAVRLTDVFSLPQSSMVRGDQLSLSIAAASILAKTCRDAWMKSIDQRFPVYGFARHKGYGTGFHRERLTQFGPCSIHRMSFQPIRSGCYEKWRRQDDSVE